MYSTTGNGGAFAFGTVFEVTQGSGGGWVAKTLHAFTDSAGGAVSSFSGYGVAFSITP